MRVSPHTVGRANCVGCYYTITGSRDLTLAANVYTRENEYLTGERGLEIKVDVVRRDGVRCVRVTNYSGTRT